MSIYFIGLVLIIKKVANLQNKTLVDVALHLSQRLPNGVLIGLPITI